MTLSILIGLYAIGFFYILYMLPKWMDGAEGFHDVLVILKNNPNKNWSELADIRLMLIVGFLMLLLWPVFIIWYWLSLGWEKVKGRA